MFGFLKSKIENFKQKISNTTQNLVGNVLANVDETEEQYSEFALDDIEDTLISADLGVSYAGELVDRLRKMKNAKPSELKSYLKEEFKKTLDSAGSTELSYKENELNIYFITGVNGAGKTTLIAKMAYLFKKEGKKVLIAAGDTFRAAAEEQLNIWSIRAGADIVRRDKADPASVVYEAIQKAKKENYDIILVDTAGRLQNKVNLMNELAKMKRIMAREIPDAPHEVLLVLDATTGQNALNQAKLFKESTDVSGIVLTKLDGTARGGIVLAIRNELHLPVKYVGLGEKVTDLQKFDAGDFVYGLFKGLVVEK